ncbi:hypothetical protein HDU97_006055 [Phlyctochytrium planicorne]|nr:hypothetical protein HDU97_006055 [Phlyctochytrium planicorne]
MVHNPTNRTFDNNCFTEADFPSNITSRSGQRSESVCKAFLQTLPSSLGESPSSTPSGSPSTVGAVSTSSPSSFAGGASTSSISTGAIAGIVIAVAIAALGAIFAFIFVRRRKAASKAALQSALSETDNIRLEKDLIVEVKQAFPGDGRDISPRQNNVIDSHTNSPNETVTPDASKESEEHELADAQTAQTSIRKQETSELFVGHSSPTTLTSPTLTFNKRVSSITPPFNKRDSSNLPLSQQLLTETRSGFSTEPIPPPSVVSENEPIRSLSIKLEFPDAKTGPRQDPALRSPTLQVFPAPATGSNEGTSGNSKQEALPKISAPPRGASRGVIPSRTTTVITSSSSRSLSSWSIEEVAQWLYNDIGVRTDVVDMLKASNLDGSRLATLTDADLVAMGVQQSYVRRSIIGAVGDISSGVAGSSSDVLPPYVGA